MKVKNVLIVIVVFVLIFSCNRDNNTTVDNFDHAGQAIIDNDSLIKFLANHYFDDTLDSIKRIDAGQLPLSNDPNMSEVPVTENDINYTLYIYTNRVGTPVPEKDHPTVMDSVLTKYRGFYLGDATTMTEFEDRQSPIWLTLSNTIRGWSYGFTNFKAGENISSNDPNGPITYQNEGKGILIMPSGLAYRNIGSAGIPSNTPLVFYIRLLDLVENTDLDNDGIPGIMEDPDGDGDPRNDDTDGNGIPNYSDPDDDGDGKLTIDESTTADADNDGIPDYLDPDS